MIFVDRSKVGTPVLFSGKSKSMDEYMQQAKNFSKDKSIEGLPHLAASLTEQERLDLVLIVTKLFDNKCAYCESLILENVLFEGDSREIRTFGQIGEEQTALFQELQAKYGPICDTQASPYEEDEFLVTVFERMKYKEIPEVSTFEINSFRPLSWAKDEYGKDDREHYWWLGNNWANYYLCCENCCTQKGDRFPVQGERIGPNQAVEEENPMLLDPCTQEDTSNHIAFEGPEAIPLTEKGALSIDVFGLNRPRLAENRRIFLEAALAKIDAYLAKDGNNSAKHLQYEGLLLPHYYPYLACLHSNLAQHHANDAETLLKLTHVLPGGLEVPTEDDSLTAEDSAAYYRDSLQSRENKEVDEIHQESRN